MYTIEQLEQIRYKNLVRAKIRKVYSIDDEISILRQKDTKPEEYQQWFDFVEGVKTEVKNLLEKQNVRIVKPK